MSRVFNIVDGLENLGALKKGGQATIYKAQRGNTTVAVKILPTFIYSTTDKSFIDFQNEVDKLKKVNENPCRYIVKILGSGITDSGSLPYIEMEFIEGKDLEELLKLPQNSVFTIGETTKVAYHLAQALAHCHKHNVKHGDIKSNNVKFGFNSQAYVLLDFGLAVMSDEQRRTSLRNAGAVEYMAPEQHSGELLFESDVYGFGVIIFELLAGVVPFPLRDNTNTSRNAVIIGHLETPLPDLKGLRRDHLPVGWDQVTKGKEMNVPDWLLCMIDGCLAKKPEDRCNAEDLLDYIISEMGRGLSVYKGKRGGTTTAIKLLPIPVYSNSDEVYLDFQEEVDILKRVNEKPCPYIVKILDSGITATGSFPFIEMPFIEGKDLKELLKPPHDSVFTINETIKVARHLSEALAHCHACDIKHCNIQSNNVKFDPDTHAYVLFGFGVAVRSGSKRRRIFREAGPVEYMAPEQPFGELLFQSDVYSFGIVLFELLAGVVPFPIKDNEDSSHTAVELAHLETSLPDLKELRRAHLPKSWDQAKQDAEMNMPDWVIKMIYKCLSKKPENRFSNGIELRDYISFEYKGLRKMVTKLVKKKGRPINHNIEYVINNDPEVEALKKTYSDTIEASRRKYTGEIEYLNTRIKWSEEDQKLTKTFLIKYLTVVVSGFLCLLYSVAHSIIEIFFVKHQSFPIADKILLAASASVGLLLVALGLFGIKMVSQWND